MSPTYEFLFYVNQIVLIFLCVYGFILAKQIKKYFKKHDYSNVVKRENRVQNILEQYMERMLCDRIIIFQFHNGENNIHNMKFMRVSATNEICRPGSYSIQDKYKNMLISKYIEICDRIFNHEEVVLPVITPESINASKYPELYTPELKSAIVVPLAINGSIMGLLTVHFAQHTQFNKQDINKVIKLVYECTGRVAETMKRDIND